MKSCNRTHIIDLNNGYSLYVLGESSLAPTPKARSFELADDRVQYAPDRPADVKHVKLDITLDFEQETVSGTVYTAFSTLYDDLKTITVPVLVMHGDDDQLVPIADTALLAVKLLRKGELKVYPGYDHGMATTHPDVINKDLLAFFKA